MRFSETPLLISNLEKEGVFNGFDFSSRISSSKSSAGSHALVTTGSLLAILKRHLDDFLQSYDLIVGHGLELIRATTFG